MICTSECHAGLVVDAVEIFRSLGQNKREITLSLTHDMSVSNMLFGFISQRLAF